MMYREAVSAAIQEAMRRPPSISQTGKVTIEKKRKEKLKRQKVRFTQVEGKKKRGQHGLNGAEMASYSRSQKQANPPCYPGCLHLSFCLLLQ